MFNKILKINVSNYIYLKYHTPASKIVLEYFFYLVGFLKYKPVNV